MPSLSELKKKKALGAVVPVDEILTREDFEKAIKVIVEAVKSTQQELKNSNLTLETDVKRKVETALGTLEKAKTELEKSTASSVTSMEATSASDRRTTMRYVEQKFLEILESLPEEYDDEDLRKDVAGLREELKDLDIPPEFDASEILKNIERIKEEIEALKKLPRGTVSGGVTDMRITQAFKNILKTEEPVGDIDGANTDYTVSQPIFAVLSFSLNGEFIAQLPNYTINGKTISFTEALPAAYSGKDFEVKYI